MRERVPDERVRADGLRGTLDRQLELALEHVERVDLEVVVVQVGAVERAVEGELGDAELGQDTFQLDAAIPDSGRSPSPAPVTITPVAGRPPSTGGSKESKPVSIPSRAPRR